ncbi:MAG: DUF6599 family protein [bacterium]|jgi:hypothetical protein
MKSRFFLSLFVVSALAAGAAAQKPDCSLVPGWTQDGPARSYEPDTLFEYMNGNAEGYLIYEFIKMNGVNCRKGGDVIVFDVSEMSGPDMAYGIFAANRDPRRPVEKVGMSGQLLTRRAIFAKGNYFVEMAGNPASEADLRAFMLAMEKRIEGTSELPETVSWFPEEKLDPATLRLVPESVLGISQLRRGYVAEYEYGKAFVVREDSPEAAAAVMTKLRSRFAGSAPVTVADEAFQANDRYLGRMVIFRKGAYLAGYSGLAEGQDGVAVASALAARIK